MSLFPKKVEYFFKVCMGLVLFEQAKYLSNYNQLNIVICFVFFKCFIYTVYKYTAYIVYKLQLN